jgi:RNA polymerase sigma-70 factor (ECF subfamily)
MNSGLVAPVAAERSDVELAAEGDEVAFGRLVARHQAVMTRLDYVIIGDRALAQDATQSAWVAAWLRLRSVREPAKVRSWLLSIAANEARQVLRRRGRVTVVEIDPEATANARTEPSTSIARLDLVRALAILAPEDRMLLALRYVAGLDAAELGAATGRSASGTRARLSRLTARLRQELDR